MQMDSDLVIYRTTLVRTFQVALSVIPRGSWGDVARRFTMIRWGLNCNFGLGGLKNCFRIIILSFGNCVDRSDLIVDRSYDEAMVIGMNRMFIWTWASPMSIGPSTSRPPLHFHLTAAARRLAPPPAAIRFLRGWNCSDHVDEEVSFVTNSSAFLVQTDEGGVIPVVDRIRRSTAAYL
ncbi:hypothetical protein F511_26791 [Dorcoceras hygrometricum]|uniref:Uncharacterized protein n=1 Tax=Dorcoceras hygrometricum TaxID=472368 RepID=A0A2Z7CZ89_9LAMI|nr:hypothetical protein F511_26791 [Dorcoceras hygrometricum]